MQAPYVYLFFWKAPSVNQLNEPEAAGRPKLSANMSPNVASSGSKAVDLNRNPDTTPDYVASLFIEMQPCIRVGFSHVLQQREHFEQNFQGTHSFQKSLIKEYT